ncbi:polysaccharide deacetylase family protein [Paenibacillus piri]|nr:polysaccharide deacetylase family protein [Paenibacillus piri]
MSKRKALAAGCAAVVCALLWLAMPPADLNPEKSQHSVGPSEATGAQSLEAEPQQQGQGGRQRPSSEKLQEGGNGRMKPQAGPPVATDSYGYGPVEEQPGQTPADPLIGPKRPAADSAAGGETTPQDGTSPSRASKPPADSTYPVKGKVAYLTFDDGPSRSTPRILSILREHGVKATFFVIGKTSEESKQQLRNIVAQGHALGNHTFSHDYKQIYKSADSFKADVDKLDRFLMETVGIKPEVLRYPGGSNNQLSWRTGGRNVMKIITREMSKNGIPYFDWNVSSTDAAAPVQDKQSIIESVKTNSAGKPNIIVLMHDMDLKTTTVEALPTVIAYLKNQGYRFDVLSKSSFTYQFLKP